MACGRTRRGTRSCTTATVYGRPSWSPRSSPSAGAPRLRRGGPARPRPALRGCCRLAQPCGHRLRSGPRAVCRDRALDRRGARRDRDHGRGPGGSPPLGAHSTRRGLGGQSRPARGSAAPLLSCLMPWGDAGRRFARFRSAWSRVVACGEIQYLVGLALPPPTPPQEPLLFAPGEANDTDFVGFHFRERDEAGSFRWTEPAALWRLALSRGDYRARLRVSLPPRDPRLRLYLNGHAVPSRGRGRLARGAHLRRLPPDAARWWRAAPRPPVGSLSTEPPRQHGRAYPRNRRPLSRPRQCFGPPVHANVWYRRRAEAAVRTLSAFSSSRPSTFRTRRPRATRASAGSKLQWP